jgi:hypothetical protein
LTDEEKKTTALEKEKSQAEQLATQLVEQNLKLTQLEGDYQVGELQGQYDQQLALKRQFEYEIAKQENQIAQNKMHHKLNIVNYENQELQARAAALDEVVRSENFQHTSQKFKEALTNQMQTEERIKYLSEVAKLRQRNNEDETRLQVLKQMDYPQLRKEMSTRFNTELESATRLEREGLELDAQKKDYQADASNLAQLQNDSRKMSIQNHAKANELEFLRERTSDPRQKDALGLYIAEKKKQLELEHKQALIKQINAIGAKNMNTYVESEALRSMSFDVGELRQAYATAVQAGVKQDSELSRLKSVMERYNNERNETEKLRQLNLNKERDVQYQTRRLESMKAEYDKNKGANQKAI